MYKIMTPGPTQVEENVRLARSMESVSYTHLLGILRSPLGESATLPTFGPSGRQERLNCWAKNLR